MKEFYHYDIAFRKKGEDIFNVISAPKYGWVADPFLVEYNNELLLFAEIFLYKSERNGKIGYSKFINGTFGEWHITMDKHWHLSYPNVFVENNRLYMVPESYQMEEVALYELVNFPNEWEKNTSIVSNVELCDSTFLDYKDGKRYMFTFERGEKPPYGKGYVYRVEDNWKVGERILFSENLDGARCGGKILERNGRFIRVAQDSTREYGGGLIFFEIDSVWPKYKEHEIEKMDPKSIKINSNRDYCGLHTYNEWGDIEVIDLKYKIALQEENEASERVRGVFCDKYR